MVGSRDLFTRFRPQITRPEKAQKSANAEGQQLTSLSKALTSSKSNRQLQSNFFSKLPVEVRVMIYKQFVADLGDILHIANSYVPYGEQGNQGKQICQPCIATPEDIVPFKSGYGPWGETHLKCSESADRMMRTGSQPRTFMPLLLSCQLMHTEAIDVIYSSVTFSLVHVNSASRFLLGVPSLQLNLIRSLHISWIITHPLYIPEFQFDPDRGPKKEQLEKYQLSKREANEWECVWRTIAGMKSLFDLQVTLYDFTWCISERDLLRPLMIIKGIENFIVELPWQIEMANNPIEGTPFRIRRPLAGEGMVKAFHIIPMMGIGRGGDR